MLTEETRKNDQCGRVIYAFLFAIGLVLASSGWGEARSLHEAHDHKAVFSNNQTAGQSCPLIHHPGRDVCPLTHHAGIGNNVVIKNCGNGSAEGISTGFSKETVVVDTFCDSRLPLKERKPFFSTAFYQALLPDPLDHPPKFL